MNQFLKGRFGLLFVFIAFVFLLALSTSLLKGKKVDLTENKLYTLSDGTKNILKGLNHEVELTLYFSDKATRELPALRAYESRVEDMLKEFSDVSGGKLRYRVVDPEPFSEAEDEAAAAGLQGVPAGVQGAEIYFGLVGKRVDSKQEQDAKSEESKTDDDFGQVIPFFQMDKEDFLEYDLAKLVYALDHPQRPRVGVLTGLKMNGGMNFMTRQQDEPWAVTEQIRDLFDVKWLDEETDTISPEEIDILLVVHPTSLSDATRLAIDQFVLGGGRALVFVDPYSEVEQQSYGMMGTGAGSDLPDLFKSWGVSWDKTKFVGDYENSMVVTLSGERKPVRHIGLLSINKDGLKNDDVILSGLELINFSSAGRLSAAEGSSTQFMPLIKSSPKSMLFDASVLATLANPESLLKDFKPTGEEYVLAARISGPAKTAFPDGILIKEAASSDETEANKENEAGDEENPSAEQAGTKETSAPKEKKVMPKLQSSDNIQVVIVADTDVLSDRLWVQIQQFFGQKIISPWANNGDFVVNALDNLSGNADLISIRSRGQFTRPFTRVQALRLQAEEKFRAQEEALQAQLAETDRKLSELEQQKGVDEKAVLSEEQKKAILDFQKQKLKIRKELRDVQHQLDKDIEALGTKIKLINIALMPLLLTMGVLVWRFWRRRRA